MRYQDDKDHSAVIGKMVLHSCKLHENSARGESRQLVTSNYATSDVEIAIML